MKAALVFALFVIACSSTKIPIKGDELQGQWDWDWMACVDGYYDPYPVLRCECDANWGGLDCGMCLNDDACINSVGGSCQNGLSTFSQIDGAIAYSCSGGVPFDAEWGAGFTFEFIHGSGGSGTFTAYAESTGAPFLYNCTFGGCSTSTQNGITTTTCTSTSCGCSTYCYASTAQSIEAASGLATFTCEVATADCELSINNVQYNLDFSCNASTCAGATPPPPPPPTPPPPPPSSCGNYDDCSDCAYAGCVWCLDDSICGSTIGGCQNVIQNPNYCPAPACSQYSDCTDCTDSGCTWCLDSYTCSTFSDVSPSCGDYVSQPAYCSL